MILFQGLILAWLSEWAHSQPQTLQLPNLSRDDLFTIGSYLTSAEVAALANAHRDLSEGTKNLLGERWELAYNSVFKLYVNCTEKATKSVSERQSQSEKLFDLMAAGIVKHIPLAAQRLLWDHSVIEHCLTLVKPMAWYTALMPVFLDLVTDAVLVATPRELSHVRTRHLPFTEYGAFRGSSETRLRRKLMKGIEYLRAHVHWEPQLHFRFLRTFSDFVLLDQSKAWNSLWMHVHYRKAHYDHGQEDPLFQQLIGNIMLQPNYNDGFVVTDTIEQLLLQAFQQLMQPSTPWHQDYPETQSLQVYPALLQAVVSFLYLQGYRFSDDYTMTRPSPS